MSIEPSVDSESRISDRRPAAAEAGSLADEFNQLWGEDPARHAAATALSGNDDLAPPTDCYGPELPAAGVGGVEAATP